MAGLRPSRRATLPKSRLDNVDIMRYGMRRILHTNRFGAGGWWPSTNPTELESDQLSDIKNMFHYDGVLQTWPGDRQRGTEQGDTQVMGFGNVLTTEVAIENIFWDTKLARRWEGSSTDDWEIEYETYTKGTVDTISGTSVTGDAGTDWATRDTTTGTRIYTGEGAEFKLDADSDDDYTVIDSVGGDTALTLAESYPGTTGSGMSAAYTIRKRFRGTTADFFASVEFQGDLYFSNGVDSLRRYEVDGTPRITAVADSTTAGNVPAASILEVYARRIVAAGLDDYARATENDQFIAWCAEADPTDWTGPGSGSRNFLETPGRVQDLKAMDESLVVYKEYDIFFGTRTDQSEPPFTFEPKITSRRHGCLSGRSVVPIDGAGHLYLGQDNFYLLRPFQCIPLAGLQIRDFVFSQINRDFAPRIQGILLEPFRKVMFLVPIGQDEPRHVGLLYDYNEDKWDGPVYTETERRVSVVGRFYRPSDELLTIGDLTGTIGALDFLFGVEVLGGGSQSILLGSDDGDVDEIAFGEELYGGEPRFPQWTSAAIYTQAPLEESVTCRVTLVYRQSIHDDSTIILELSGDGFGTTIAQDQQTLLSDNPGAISKVYFDYIVSSERLQARCWPTQEASQIQILEIGVEVTAVGEETPR